MFDELLCSAAEQGSAEARTLSEETDRILEMMDRAKDPGGLLNGGMAAEDALCRALHRELAAIDRIQAGAEP